MQLPHHGAYSLQKVTLIGKGNRSNDYKLSFYPPENQEGIVAYLIGYSVRDIGEVRSFLETLTKEELFLLDKPVNRGYIITNLKYADGAGNTFNSSQKDLVTGQDFSQPGTYHFYAITVGQEGFLGIEQAARTVTKLPIGDQLMFERVQNLIQGSFRVFEEERELEYAVFYSAKGYTKIQETMSGLSPSAIRNLIETGRAVLAGQEKQGTFSFDLSELTDVDGYPYDPEKWYYVFLVTLEEREIRGITYQEGLFITPAEYPEPLTTIGAGPGHGTLFPNGGAATIDRTRNSIISSSQSIFQRMGANPKIAIIGASSGNEALNSHAFHYGSGKSKSDRERFAEAGFEAVYIPLTLENFAEVGENEYFCRLLEAVHGVYFLGGDQFLAVRAMTREDGGLNRLGQAIASLYRKGGVLMGSSAGAHVLGDDAFQGAESSYLALHYNHTEFIRVQDHNGAPSSQLPGNSIFYGSLQLAREATGYKTIFDSHFHARGRFGRLLVAMKDSGAIFGIGLDEGTGLIIHDSVGRVVGVGGVTLLDATEASFGSGPTFSVENLKIHYLTSGDSFDFHTVTVTPLSSKKLYSGDVSLYREELEGFADVFGKNYKTPKALFSFLAGNIQTFRFSVPSPPDQEEAPPFIAEVTKTRDTQLYFLQNPFSSVNELLRYPVFGFTHLFMSVKRTGDAGAFR